jgi:hypothetical protein
MDALQIQEKIDIEYIKYLRKLNDGELGLGEAHLMLNHLPDDIKLWQLAALAKALAVYQCGE